MIFMIAGLLLSQQKFGPIDIFNLRFNGYAVMSFIGGLANIIFFFYLWRSKLSNEETSWYLVFLTSITLFSFTECMMRLSATPQAAVFWAQFSTIGLALEPLLILMFILTLVNPSKRNAVMLASLLIGASVITFFNANGPLIFYNELSHTFLMPWGYNNEVGPAYFFNLAWYSLFGVVAIFIMFFYRRKVTSPVLKKQATIFLLAISVPIIGGFITDGIGPAIGLKLPPSHSFLSTIMAFMILYGMKRYQFFKVTPASISQEILNTMSESVLVLNEKYEIELMNDSAEQLLGKSFSQLSHQSLFASFGDDQQEALRKGFQAAKDSVKTKVVNEVNFHHAGKTRYLRISISRTSSEGGLLGYVLAITDVTPLKLSYLELQDEKANVDRKVRERTQQLASTQARLLASIGSLQQGFIMTDKQFKVLTTNAAARKILNQGNKRTLDIEDLDMPVAHHKRLPEQIKQSFKHRESMVFNEATHGDRILSVFISPIIQNEEIIGNVILLNDVTEERILQRSKDEFFSIASHELRTPLTAIRGNAGMMLDFYKKTMEKEPDLKQMIRDIQNSSIQLIEIVTDFLDVSRIEQGKVAYNKMAFEIEKVIEHVIYEMHAVIKEKKLYLKTDTKTIASLPQVYADQERTKQILYNLIGNAAKFTDQGGISVSAEVKDNKYLYVTVADTGRGLTPESKQLLFHKFQQAGESLLTRDTTRGTGLGLYISRMLTENMGGEIKLESSAPGRGSVFSFTLPLATKEQIAQTSAAIAETKKTVVDTKTGLTISK